MTPDPTDFSRTPGAYICQWLLPFDLMAHVSSRSFDGPPAPSEFPAAELAVTWEALKAQEGTTWRGSLTHSWRKYIGNFGVWAFERGYRGGMHVARVNPRMPWNGNNCWLYRTEDGLPRDVHGGSGVWAIDGRAFGSPAEAAAAFGVAPATAENWCRTGKSNPASRASNGRLKFAPPPGTAFRVPARPENVLDPLRTPELVQADFEAFRQRYAVSAYDTEGSRQWHERRVAAEGRPRSGALRAAESDDRPSAVPDLAPKGYAPPEGRPRHRGIFGTGP